MPRYRVPVEWTASAVIEVDANNDYDAAQKVEELSDKQGCPWNIARYVDDSWVLLASDITEVK